MSRLRRWIDRRFKLEEINGRNACPTYLYRWELLRTRWFQVYLHHFVGDDWSRDLHDHPKRFISIGLKGGYTETTPGCLGHHYVPRAQEEWGCGEIVSGASWTMADPIRCGRSEAEHLTETRYRAPWLRTFPADHQHRLRLDEFADCWTLVIVLKVVREWGFWHAGKFVPWRRYVGSGEATSRRACP